MDVNLNLCKYFIAVMEEQNITKAAAKMGVSQPTVTYNIQTLEKSLRHKLFTVGRDGVIPSRYAIILYQSMKPSYTALMTVFERLTRR